MASCGWLLEDLAPCEQEAFHKRNGTSLCDSHCKEWDDLAEWGQWLESQSDKEKSDGTKKNHI